MLYKYYYIDMQLYIVSKSNFQTDLLLLLQSTRGPGPWFTERREAEKAGGNEQSRDTKNHEKNNKYNTDHDSICHKSLPPLVKSIQKHQNQQVVK